MQGFPYSKMKFEELSHSRWFASEILQLIINDYFEDPFEVLWNFELRMEYCKHIAEQDKNESAKRMFSIAIKTAKDIRRLLSSYERGEH